MVVQEQLALFGGTAAVKSVYSDMFKWPIITEEDEVAALDVLRNGNMSGIDITVQFEKEFAAWLKTDYALAFNTGTASIHAAIFACGVGVGDEIICPSLTYWASLLQVYSLGGTPVFAEVDPDTLCLDPDDIEHRITERTKAIVVVHYIGHPADMDRIMAIAKKHNLKVIEDVSHAQGSLYKGSKVGTIGDVGAMSLMSGKSFAIGEGGILVTNQRDIYERAVAFGHYERFGANIQSEELKPFAGLPLGGYKYRMHQVSSAVGRVQLKYYEQRIAEIDKASNYFWDQLAGLPGIRAHRPAQNSGSTMGGWYSPHGFYVGSELGGLSVTRFCEALQAEGAVDCSPGCNLPLHLHPLFHEADIYGHGKPTRIAHSQKDIRQGAGSLPVTEGVNARVFAIPWFKHNDSSIIDEYVHAFRKVIGNAHLLLENDPGNPPMTGNWNLSTRVTVKK
ncbi:DegT/DnrJ/EryC1/StrS family aminotransferase [Paenibacillus eucommiae]|uniref:dTDP-4-amino-4,6-dideoxygalactose transaminase n=1 Tax=Paenibacillus eucommiae TaxID=1355755 RepID=A0ABS4IY58_9BACL|nr:DegT/DnrJ/EryC1/StrS family aminotransferase [Paenibacillus eucommiae]MBP1992507.1 dTDP-4-amino-4,6-dideoxygalactose transaminase [Paenibacillus eucommiae]